MITDFRIIGEGKTAADFAEWGELKTLMEGKTTLDPIQLAIPDISEEEMQEIGKRHNMSFVRRSVYWEGGGKHTQRIEVERG